MPVTLALGRLRQNCVFNASLDYKVRPCLKNKIKHIKNNRNKLQKESTFKHSFFFYSYVHTMFGSFLPSSPTPYLPYLPCPLPVPTTPSLPGRNYFALKHLLIEK
jgi:hypothetical protein